MVDNKTVKKDDFVEIKFTGKTNGQVFDSNIEEELKKVNPDAKAKETIISVGHKMILDALDDQLIGKEVGKEYEAHIKAKDGFGARKRELIKTIPLKVFHAQKINPQAGQTLYLDNAMVRIAAVSGARVIVDFNNPLAGKDLDYTFTIVRIVDDEKEKVNAFLLYFLKSEQKFELEGEKVVLLGPEPFKHFVEAFKDKAKEILNKELVFKEDKEATEKFKKQMAAQQQVPQ